MRHREGGSKKILLQVQPMSGRPWSGAPSSTAKSFASTGVAASDLVGGAERGKTAWHATMTTA